MNPATVSSGKKVLVVGELLVDVISVGNVESLACAAQYVTNQGGSAANLCANLKWLGVEAELVAAVGNDNLGTFLINELKTAGVSDTYISRSAYRQTSIVLVAKNDHTPDFIPYRSADSAIKRVEDAAIDSSYLLHTTAFALSKAPAQGNILNAFKKAKNSGKHVSVDWNFAPAIWQEDDGQSVFRQLMAMNPLLKISTDDLERFTGEKLSLTDAMAWLDNTDAAIICLTCGKEGVWFKEKNQSWQHRPAHPVSSVIGVTGAGDAFWSGFIASFLSEKAVEDCIAGALEIARLKIEKATPLYK